jgi:hypothetical protein
MVTAMRANTLQQQHYLTEQQTSELCRLSDTVLAIIFAHSEDKPRYVTW